MTSRLRVSALVLAAFVTSFGRSQAPPDVVERIVAETASNSQVMQHLDHLTNQIGPRLTGSERLTRACSWARDRFEAFGVQGARLEQWGTVEVGFDRGVHAGWLLSGREKKALTFGTHAWTPGTGGLKEGKAILAPPDASGLDALADAAKGAWVVRPAGSKARGQINDVCERAGALGVIASGGSLILTGGNHNTKWDALPKLVRINLLATDFDDLVRRLERGDDVRLAFDVQNHFKQGPIPLYNVIADIRGTEKPDEMVIVGGHIDSWDGATGTTDNGTGTATTLEAARLLMVAGAKPRRTIRFMLWSGEEQGLLGSVAWISQHPDELERISAVLVHDGGTNYVSGIQSTPAMLPLMERAFAPVTSLVGPPAGRPERRRGESTPASRPSEPERLGFGINEVRALPRGVGSDHDAFLARGVPGFFWRQSGRADYTRTHHTQYDTYDAAIPEYQKHTSKVVALGALGIANLDEMLPRSRDMASRPSIATGRRRLGVSLGGEDADDLTIQSVREGSRAERLGLKPGDRLVKVDGVALKDSTELAGALNTGGPTKKIVYQRGGTEHEVVVEFEGTETRPQ
jgi:hypothetical protein